MYIKSLEWYSLNDCVAHPNNLYVFGDNDIGKGCGGQAVIRYCANSIGIPTKKLPSNTPDSFYTDRELYENMKKIDKALSLIVKRANNYTNVVFPSDGLGTGRAQLEIKAPMTYKYICTMISQLFGITW